MTDSATDPYAGRATFEPDAAAVWASTEGQLANLGYYALCLAFCWLLFPIVAMFARYLQTALHCYELTAQRFKERTGVFSRHTEELELYRVKDIAVEEPLMQRLFGRGRVVLRTSDRSTPVVILNCIRSPRDVARLLREQVEKCRVMKGVREID
jgi:uncharacterized membrane protein YdbT with pleckstrin-like domain